MATGPGLANIPARPDTGRLADHDPLGKLWKNPHDRKHTPRNLLRGTWRATYRRHMTRALDRFDARL